MRAPASGDAPLLKSTDDGVLDVAFESEARRFRV